jgi:hypothetical protein
MAKQRDINISIYIQNHLKHDELLKGALGEEGWTLWTTQMRGRNFLSLSSKLERNFFSNGIRLGFRIWARRWAF